VETEAVFAESPYLGAGGLDEKSAISTLQAEGRPCIGGGRAHLRYICTTLAKLKS
jgi:hypothetical protein